MKMNLRNGEISKYEVILIRKRAQSELKGGMSKFEDLKDLKKKS